MNRDFQRCLAIWIAAFAVAHSGCDHSDNVTGPSPTPTPAPRPVDGAWTGAFEGEAPLVECIAFGAGVASADLHETGSSITGTMSWHQEVCNVDGASIQATRMGDTFSGTATFGGATDTVSGNVGASELIIILTRPSSGGGFPGGTATLHRP